MKVLLIQFDDMTSIVEDEDENGVEQGEGRTIAIVPKRIEALAICAAMVWEIVFDDQEDYKQS